MSETDAKYKEYLFSVYDPLAVRCPYCGSKSGKLCSDCNGRGERYELQARFSHDARFNHASNEITRTTEGLRRERWKSTSLRVMSDNDSRKFPCRPVRWG